MNVFDIRASSSILFAPGRVIGIFRRRLHLQRLDCSKLFLGRYTAFTAYLLNNSLCFLLSVGFFLTGFLFRRSLIVPHLETGDFPGIPDNRNQKTAARANYTRDLHSFRPHVFDKHRAYTGLVFNLLGKQLTAYHRYTNEAIFFDICIRQAAVMKVFPVLTGEGAFIDHGPIKQISQ